MAGLVPASHVAVRGCRGPEPFLVFSHSHTGGLLAEVWLYEAVVESQIGSHAVLGNSLAVLALAVGVPGRKS